MGIILLPGINTNNPIYLPPTAPRHEIPTSTGETSQYSMTAEVFSKCPIRESSIPSKTSFLPINQTNMKSQEESEKDKVINGLFVSDAPDKYKSIISSTLKKLPLSILKTVEKGNFRIQVVQTGENDPLPFKVKEFDVEEFKKNLPDKILHFEEYTKKENESDSNISTDLERIDPDMYLASQSWEMPVTLKQIAVKHGAESPAQLKEYIELIKSCNPDILFPTTFSEQYEVSPGQSINYPTFTYYKGKRIPCENTIDGHSNSLYDRLTSVDKGGTTFAGTFRWLPHTEDVPDRLILFYDKWLDQKDVGSWTIRHEIYHAVDYTLNELDPEFHEKMESQRSALYEIKKNENGFLTRYSRSKDNEYAAEGFAALFSDQEKKDGKAADNTKLIEWYVKGRAKSTGLLDESYDKNQVVTVIKEKQSITSEVLKEKDPGLYSLLEDTIKETGQLNATLTERLRI